MSKKKEIFKAMQAKLEGQSTKTGARQLANHLLRILLSKHRNRSKGRRELGEAETRPRKRKKEGATVTEHSWPDNERILTSALQELELEQPTQAVSATMQDVVTLPITLSEQRSARHRQKAYLLQPVCNKVDWCCIESSNDAFNQVTLHLIK